MTKQQLETLQRNRAAKPRPTETVTTINADLPSELHRRFKAACVLAGCTFSQAVTQAVAEWTKEQGQ